MTASVVRGLTLTVAAAALLVGAAVVGAGVRGFLARAQTAPGVVTRLLAGGSHPEVRFVTTAGQEVLYAQGGLIFGYTPGRTVRVRYDPSAPRATACLDDVGALWGPTLLLAVVGLVLLAGGVLPLLIPSGVMR